MWFLESTPAWPLGTFLWLLVLCPPVAIAQRDSFKLIPKADPRDNAQFIAIDQPEIVCRPQVLQPADPELAGISAKLCVKVLVDRGGTVRKARILRSSDDRFNSAALGYARQYRFRWPEPEKLPRMVWVAIPVMFSGGAQ